MEEEEASCTMQDSELEKLQRQLRVLENTRKANIDEMRNVIRKQEAEFEMLKSDNEEIKLVLQLVRTNRNEKLSSKDQKHLLHLVETYDDIQRKLEENKKDTSKLDEEIDNVRKEKCHRLQMYAPKYCDTKEAILEKRVRAVENRLEKQTAHFNKQLSHNAKLRTQIDDIRQERKTYEKIYTRLVNELDDIHSDMNNLLSDATNSYGEREEAHLKISNLKERSAKDLAQHQLEIRKYDRSIHHDNSLDDFMATKIKDHDCLKQERVLSMKKEEKDMVVIRQQLDTYEEALKQIQRITGETDVETIVSKFLANEEENFALFKYINELNTELEGVTEAIRQTQREISKLEEAGADMQSKQQEKFQSIKAETLSRATESEKGRNSVVKTRKTFEVFEHGVASLFKMLRCDPALTYNILAADTEVNENTILHHMAVIDQRVTELLQIKQYLDMGSQPKKEINLSSFNENSGPIQNIWNYLNMVPPNIE